MGIVFRQSIKSTAATFAGAILGAVIMLISSNMIPQQELGFSRNLTNQTVVASFFILMGMSSTLFLYFHRFDEKKDQVKRAVFMSMCFLVPLAVFLLILIPYFLFQDYLLHFFQDKDRPFMKQYILCFPLYTLFYLYSVLIEAYLLTQLKIAAASAVKEVLLKGMNLMLVLLFGFNIINYTVFIYGFVLINSISLSILILLARKNPSFRFSLQWKVFSKKEYREMFSFSGYHALMSMTYSIMGFMDAILLAGLDADGLNSIPVYTNAVFISSVMSMPHRAMNSAASADISKSYALGQHEKVRDVYNRAGINIFIATVFMAVLISCNLGNAVTIMGKGYEAVFAITLIMMIGKLADSGTGLNDLALNMSPHFKLNFYFSIGLILFMTSMFRVFIPIYGIYGAAVIFSLSLMLYNLLKTFFVWKKMGLQPFSRGTLTALLIGISVTALVFYIPQIENPYWDTIFRSTIVTILFIGMVFWLKPSKDISHYVNETLRKKRLF